MHQPVIEVQNLGKTYTLLHEQGKYVALRDVIMNVLKSPARFFVAKAKRTMGIGTTEELWAVKDVNFTVEKGEVIGIIGKNGAGKSTLLKILSQITPPTTGQITIRGRVGSLLEVGTGFHPELTGRENIFLNGAILGMSKKEIVDKFEQIVDFAGIRKFLDTPVKHYSSGMYVRLAFSVAAHMEPDILIIDEVLAVGDAEFQKKCIGKMNEITQEQGRTILFVSHNLQSVSELCSRTILLKDGSIEMVGETEAVLKHYADDFFSVGLGELTLEPKAHAEATFTGVRIVRDDGITANVIPYGQNVTIGLEMDVRTEISNAEISVSIKNSKGVDVAFLSLSDSTDGKLRNFAPGSYSLSIACGTHMLMPDNYYLRISIHHPGHTNIDTREDVMGFQIHNDSSTRSPNYGIGCVALPATWSL